MSPASSRSTSISSSSKNNTTATTTPDPAKKKFACSFPACGKAFSRSEHLHRHALNHKDGNNTCLRCSAHFRRRDLLDRHMARHKEKDDEAGGAGLGILATRKRLWRDAAGNIVNARRPSYTQDGNSNNSSSKQRRQTVSSGRVEKKSSASHTSTRSNPRRGIHALTTTAAAAAAAAALPSPTESLAGTGRLGDSENETIVVEMQKYEYPDPDEDGPKISLGDESTSSASWLEMQHLPSPPTTSRSSLSLPSEAQSPSAGDLSDLEGLYEESSATWGAPPSLHEHHHDVLGARGPRIASVGGDEIYGSSSSSSWASGASQHPHHHHLAHTHPLHQHHPHHHHQHHQPSFQTFMGAMAELPYDDIFKPEAGLYEWQAWNQNVLLSRCREEKYEPGLGSGPGAGLGAAVYAGAAAVETAATVGAEAGSAGASLSRAFELGSC